jgi:hypothetical protein
MISLRRLPSVRPLEQDSATCYAHGIARSLTRTLQILNIVPPGFDFHFYKLFYILITDKYGCNGKDVEEACNYIIYEYLQEQSKVKYRDLFAVKDDGLGNTGIVEEHRDQKNAEIDKINPRARLPILGEEPLHIISITEKPKRGKKSSEKTLMIRSAEPEIEGFSKTLRTEFVIRLNKVLPYLIIIEECYFFHSYNKDKENHTKPSLLTIDSLNRGLQPIVTMAVPADIPDDIFEAEKAKPDGVRQIDYLGNGDYNICGEDSHSVVLRWWKKDSISVKNSWGTRRFNKNHDGLGNIVLENDDISKYTCYIKTDDPKYPTEIENIFITHITFDNILYKTKFVKEKYDEIQSRGYTPNTDYTREDLDIQGENELLYINLGEIQMNYLIDNDLIDIRYLLQWIMSGEEQERFLENHDDLPELSNYLLFKKYLAKYQSKKDIKKYINIRDNDGNTPLYYAIYNITNMKMLLKIIEELLAAGADITIRNNTGHIPYDFELARHELDGEDEEIHQEILELLTPVKSRSSKSTSVKAKSKGTKSRGGKKTRRIHNA